MSKLSSAGLEGEEPEHSSCDTGLDRSGVRPPVQKGKEADDYTH